MLKRETKPHGSSHLHGGRGLEAPVLREFDRRRLLMLGGSSLIALAGARRLSASEAPRALEQTSIAELDVGYLSGSDSGADLSCAERFLLENPDSSRIVNAKSLSRGDPGLAVRDAMLTLFHWGGSSRCHGALTGRRVDLNLHYDTAVGPVEFALWHYREKGLVDAGSAIQVRVPLDPKSGLTISADAWRGGASTGGPDDGPPRRSAATLIPGFQPGRPKLRRGVYLLSADRFADWKSLLAPQKRFPNPLQRLLERAGCSSGNSIFVCFSIDYAS